MIPGLMYSLRTDGKAKLAATVLITANVVNLTLDWVYISLLGMRIGGSSLATVSGYLIGSMVLMGYVSAKDRTLKFNFKLLAMPTRVLNYVGQILVIGSPSAVSGILMTLNYFA